MNMLLAYIVVLFVLFVLISVLDYKRDKLKGSIIIARLLCFAIVVFVNTQVLYYNKVCGNIMELIVMVIMIIFIKDKYQKLEYSRNKQMVT